MTTNGQSRAKRKVAFIVLILLSVSGAIAWLSDSSNIRGFREVEPSMEVSPMASTVNITALAPIVNQTLTVPGGSITIRSTVQNVGNVAASVTMVTNASTVYFATNGATKILAPVSINTSTFIIQPGNSTYRDINWEVPGIAGTAYQLEVTVIASGNVNTNVQALANYYVRLDRLPSRVTLVCANCAVRGNVYAMPSDGDTRWQLWGYDDDNSNPYLVNDLHHGRIAWGDGSGDNIEPACLLPGTPSCFPTEEHLYSPGSCANVCFVIGWVWDYCQALYPVSCPVVSSAVANLGSPGGSVGGKVVPIDMLSLLAPFTGLASLIVAATTVTVVYVRRSKNVEKIGDQNTG